MASDKEEDKCNGCGAQKEWCNCKVDDGGPAFPSEQGHIPNGTWNQTYDPGMSLRDWFAGQALMGACANPELCDVEAYKHIPRRSYEAADAMIKEIEK